MAANAFTNEELEHLIMHHKTLSKVEIAYQYNKGRDAINDHFVQTQNKYIALYEEILAHRNLAINCEILYTPRDAHG